MFLGEEGSHRWIGAWKGHKYGGGGRGVKLKGGGGEEGLAKNGCQQCAQRAQKGRLTGPRAKKGGGGAARMDAFYPLADGALSNLMTRTLNLFGYEGGWGGWGQECGQKPLQAAQRFFSLIMFYEASLHIN
jgi:hypothetical protein